MGKKKKRLHPLRLILRILAGLLALLLLAALVFTLLPLGETVEKTSLPGATDWMAPLPDGRLLSELTIPRQCHPLCPAGLVFQVPGAEH